MQKGVSMMLIAATATDVVKSTYVNSRDRAKITRGRGLTDLDQPVWADLEHSQMDVDD